MSQYVTSPTAINSNEKTQYTVTINAADTFGAVQPVTPPPPPHTRPSESTITRPDGGYVPRGHQRKVDENGVWKIVKDPAQGRIAQDVYEDQGTFMEDRATVQIVTFHKTEERQAEWANQLKLPKDAGKLAATLKRKGDPNKTWRWIHCEGLHGPTMKTIAKETGWPLDKFAGIFAWTRPSSEWASGCLRVHFLDQLTPIWMLFREDESNPVFITCTKLDPNQKLKTRWEDFVDFGDSRPDLLLRKDPSLMLYAMMRAVIQDLRFTASQKHRDMTAAYNLAMSKPSQKSLQYFYELQQSLIRIKLDTTSLRDAATNLIIFVDGMQKEASIIGKEPLISDDTQYMLKDQIGLITLLFEELPEVTRQAEAVANLAFNSLSFNTNNLLRLLAVLTMASVPLTIATGVLGVNYFSGDVVTGATVAIVLCSVTGAIILGLLVYLAWGWGKKRHPHYRRGVEQRNISLEAYAESREAEQRFADLEAQNQRLRTFQSKMDAPRPDYLPVIIESPTLPTHRKTTLAAVSDFVRVPRRQTTDSP